MRTLHTPRPLAIATAMSFAFAGTDTAGAATRSMPVTSVQPDTIFIEVGSSRVDGRVYQPHRARVRIRTDGFDGPVVNEWINELTVGDSAGRPVHRWITTSNMGPGKGSVLRQTFDAVSLAPLGWVSESVTGASQRLTLGGRVVRGVRRAANDTTAIAIERDITRAGFIASASDLLPAAIGMKRGVVVVAPFWSPAMAVPEDRVFHVLEETNVPVEGTTWTAWKVEERRRTDRALLAVWYLTDKSPYMVAGEMYLPDGRKQWATEVALDR